MPTGPPKVETLDKKIFIFFGNRLLALIQALKQIHFTPLVVTRIITSGLALLAAGLALTEAFEDSIIGIQQSAIIIGFSLMSGLCFIALAITFLVKKD